MIIDLTQHSVATRLLAPMLDSCAGDLALTAGNGCRGAVSRSISSPNPLQARYQKKITSSSSKSFGSFPSHPNVGRAHTAGQEAILRLGRIVIATPISKAFDDATLVRSLHCNVPRPMMAQIYAPHLFSPLLLVGLESC